MYVDRLECTKAPSANASSSSSTRPQIISLETPILTHFYAKVMFTKHKQISTVSVKYLDGLQTKFFLAWRGFMVRTPRGANVHSQPLDDFPGGVSLPQPVPHPEMWNKNQFSRNSRPHAQTEVQDCLTKDLKDYWRQSVTCPPRYTLPSFL